MKITFKCTHCQSTMGLEYAAEGIPVMVSKLKSSIIKNSRVLCPKCEKWGPMVENL